MAADNAIIIGMIAANFAPKNRRQIIMWGVFAAFIFSCLLYTSPSPRDGLLSRMPSSA